MQKRLFNWLTALLLVLGQTALLAHQADIHAHQDQGDDCSICQIAHSLDNVAAVAGTPFVLTPEPDAHTRPLLQSLIAVTRPPACSRAPPAPLA